MKITYYKPKKSLMARANSPWLALTVLAGFVAFCVYVWQNKVEASPYTLEERCAIHPMIVSGEADACYVDADGFIKPLMPENGIVYLYGGSHD